MPHQSLTLKGWEFDLAFRTGLRAQGELVRLLLLKNTDGDGPCDSGKPRVGLAVGKRQGKAHVRNRGRRILREAFRRLAPWVTPGVTLILSLKDKGLHAKATEIFEDLALVLRRKKLLTGTGWKGRDWNEGRDKR